MDHQLNKQLGYHANPPSLIELLPTFEIEMRSPVDKAKAAVNSGTYVTGVGDSSSVTFLQNKSISYVYQEVLPNMSFVFIVFVLLSAGKRGLPRGQLKE